MKCANIVENLLISLSLLTVLKGMAFNYKMLMLKFRVIFFAEVNTASLFFINIDCMHICSI